MSRELDALAAEHVIGECVSPTFQIYERVDEGNGNIGEYLHDIPHYSSNIAHAWQLVDAMRAEGWFSSVTDLTIDSGVPDWCWRFIHIKDSSNTLNRGRGPAPLAITLAALKAKGIDVSKWEGEL